MTRFTLFCLLKKSYVLLYTSCHISYQFAHLSNANLLGELSVRRQLNVQTVTLVRSRFFPIRIMILLIKFIQILRIDFTSTIDFNEF